MLQRTRSRADQQAGPALVSGAETAGQQAQKQGSRCVVLQGKEWNWTECMVASDSHKGCDRPCISYRSGMFMQCHATPSDALLNQAADTLQLPNPLGQLILVSGWLQCCMSSSTGSYPCCRRRGM